MLGRNPLDIHGEKPLSMPSRELLDIRPMKSVGKTIPPYPSLAGRITLDTQIRGQNCHQDETNRDDTVTLTAFLGVNPPKVEHLQG
jgi:hypothetical protein